MRSSVKRQFCRWDALAAALVLLLAAATFWGYYLRGGESGALTVTVTQGERLLYHSTLAAIEDELLLTPPGLSYPLTIRLTPTGAEVIESSCPSQDCLHSGAISRSGESIICLPNRLVIRLDGGGEVGIDAALG